MLDPHLGWWLATALIAFLVLGVLAWFRKRKRDAVLSGTDDDRIDTVIGWPPSATRLMTPAERLAFATLLRALPDYTVLSQVPLARFIDVPKRNSYAEWLRRIGYQSIDFLICDSNSQIVAVVDVQQAAAQTSARGAKRQARIARTLKAAGVPLHVWLATSFPSAEAARDSILGLSKPAALTSAITSADPQSAEPTQPGAEVTTPAGAGAATARNPFDDIGRDSTQDELIEAQEPPLSTWYDEFDSGPTPLAKPDKRPRR